MAIEIIVQDHVASHQCYREPCASAAAALVICQGLCPTAIEVVGTIFFSDFYQSPARFAAGDAPIAFWQNI